MQNVLIQKVEIDIRANHSLWNSFEPIDREGFLILLTQHISFFKGLQRHNFECWILCAMVIS